MLDDEHDVGEVMLDPVSGCEGAKIAHVSFAVGAPMDTSGNDDGSAGTSGVGAPRTDVPHTGLRPRCTRAPSALLGWGFRAAPLLLLFCLALPVGPAPQAVLAQMLGKPDAPTFSAARAASVTVYWVHWVPPVNTGPSIKGYEFEAVGIAGTHVMLPAAGGERARARKGPWPVEWVAHLRPQSNDGWGPFSDWRRQNPVASGTPVSGGVGGFRRPLVHVFVRTQRRGA